MLICAAGAITATPVSYSVAIDTSSISGTQGSVDLNFNPGPLGAQLALAQVTNFTTDGTFEDDCPCATGNVSGTLPGTLVLNNGSGFNDYFDGFAFGSTLFYNVTLLGPALSSPDGISKSGSTFAFSLFSDAAGTMPTLTSDSTDGLAFVIDVDTTGTTTISNFSKQTLITTGSVAPEPSTAGFLVSASVMTGMLVQLANYRNRRQI